MAAFFYYCSQHKHIKLDHSPNYKADLCPFCIEKRVRRPHKLKKTTANKYNNFHSQKNRRNSPHKNTHKQESVVKNKETISKEEKQQINKIKKRKRKVEVKPTTKEDLGIFVSMLQKMIDNPVGVIKKNLPMFFSHLNNAIDACNEGIAFCNAYGAKFEGFSEFVIACSEDQMYKHYSEAKKYMAAK